MFLIAKHNQTSKNLIDTASVYFTNSFHANET